MISQNTAQKISNVCNQMESCNLAINLIKEELASAGKPEVFINVAKNLRDGGITVALVPETAEVILYKQLEVLRDEYKELNELAAEELKAT